MNFDLTREQQAVQKMIREFAEKEVKPIAADIDISEEFPMENFQKLVKYGVIGMNMPEMCIRDRCTARRVELCTFRQGT